MSKTVLLAFVLPGAWLSSDALRTPPAPLLSDWSYYPPDAKLGILTGGTPDLYEKMNYGTKDAAVMLKYAKRHGYAFYLERNWGRISKRRGGWNKVALMHKLLREVPYVVWMDADLLLQELDKPMEELVQNAHCDGIRQKAWNNYLPRVANNRTFMWLNADVSPNRFLVNVNTAMVLLKQSPEAFHFLEQVWAIGNKTDYYMHHSNPVRRLHNDPNDPQHDWPFEQGAFWDVMANDPETFMKGACVVPETYFHSVRAYMYQKGVFALKMEGLPDKMRRERAQVMLNKAGGKVEVH